MNTTADPHHTRPGENIVTMYVAIAAVPLAPLPRLWRRYRRVCGANPLRWAGLAVGAAGYLLGVLVYLVFTLGILLSYVIPLLLALPLIVVVYLTKALARWRPGLLGTITQPPWWDAPDDGAGPGGAQIVLDDPSGNPIELFQPAAR